MALTPEQQLVILNAVNAKLRPRRLVCPISGDGNWQVERYYGLLYSSDGAGTSQSRSHSFPLAVLTCQTCGYTSLVNLVKLGLASHFGILPNEDL